MRLILIALLVFTAPIFANNIDVRLTDGFCRATVDGEEYKCSVGKYGIVTDKVEGDGRTPIGEFPLRRVLVRSDKINSNRLKYVSLPVQKIKPHDGWCDDIKDKSYNQQVDLTKLDKKSNHEQLYRTDDIYDIVIVVGYNDEPSIAGKGSAIFVRVARFKYDGTDGSVALSHSDLMKILPKLDHNSKLIVHAN